jgi:hypothetical protein
MMMQPLPIALAGITPQAGAATPSTSALSQLPQYPRSGQEHLAGRRFVLALSRAGCELIYWNRRVRSMLPSACALSCAIAGIAIGVRLLLGDALIGVPFITVFPAVVIATFLGGLGPGVLAIVLGGAAAWTVLLPEPDPAAAGVDPRLAPLLTYAMVAGFDGLLIDRLLKSAERNAVLAGRNELLRRELQHRVKNHVQLVSSLLNIQAARAQA